MNRTDAIVKIDEALDRLEEVRDILEQLGGTYYMCERIRTKIEQLEDLRVDIMQADLLQEDK